MKYLGAWEGSIGIGIALLYVFGAEDADIYA
jgi:hypothetical protein